MANPTIVNCAADTWVKVATNVTNGQIHVKDTSPRYLSTYRVTGDPAPTDDADSVQLFASTPYSYISSTVAIDVYVKAIGEAGKVRVDI